MRIIYFSPHLDDAVLSCGGLIWQQVQDGHSVQIWTLCAGDPPGPLSNFARELHQRWGSGPNPVAARRQEDILACQRLGAACRHFPIPDCIYRVETHSSDFIYSDREAIFGTLNEDEALEIIKSSVEILVEIPQEAVLVCPLTVGGHVDHKLTRRVIEQFGRPLVYYADYPYAAAQYSEWKDLVPNGFRNEIQDISPEALRHWQDSVATYRSQISTFWPDKQAMEIAIRDYCMRWKGIPIWESA
jgi:LmbE family N-acetylglucosaminyl deacetylase